MHSMEVDTKYTEDDSYTIPAGKTLQITRFSGGIESSNKEVRCTLLCDGEILAVGYAGAAFQFAVDHECVGDGSKKVIIRHYTEEKLHMSGWWEGILIDG